MLDILLTLTGLASGLLIGVLLMWTLGGGVAGAQSSGASQSDSPTAESLNTALLRLQSLAYSVAASVEVHSDRVDDISESLTNLRDEGKDGSKPMLAAIQAILSANDEMQAELQRANSRIVEQSQELEHARTQARTDALTGVFNRLAFEEFLRSSIEDFNEGKQATSLLMVDVDNFRHFNDTHGHSAGDAVLSHVAKFLQNRLSKRGLVARYGGEEFAVVFAGSEAGSVQHIIEQTRADLALQEITFGDQNYTITCSAGLAQLIDNDTFDSIIDRADEGLYLSKDEGRNCGHWWNGDRWVRMTAQALNRDSMAKLLAAKEEFASTPGDSGSIEATAEPKDQTAGVASASEDVSDPGSLEQTKAAEEAEDLAGAEFSPPVPEESDEEHSDPQAREPNSENSANSTVEDAEDSGPVAVLEWEEFLDRMKAGLDQAARLDLPLSVLMISYKKKSGANSSFETQDDIPLPILNATKAGLKGLDVIGKYDESTLTILLRGCEEAVGIGRAALVRDAIEKTASLPESFRIDLAVAASGSETQAIKMIDNLKEALTLAKFESQPSLAICGDGDCRIAEPSELAVAS